MIGPGFLYAFAQKPILAVTPCSWPWFYTRTMPTRKLTQDLKPLPSRLVAKGHNQIPSVIRYLLAFKLVHPAVPWGPFNAKDSELVVVKTALASTCGANNLVCQFHAQAYA